MPMQSFYEPIPFRATSRVGLLYVPKHCILSTLGEQPEGHANSQEHLEWHFASTIAQWFFQSLFHPSFWTTIGCILRFHLFFVGSNRMKGLQVLEIHIYSTSSVSSSITVTTLWIIWRFRTKFRRLHRCISATTPEFHNLQRLFHMHAA